MKEIEIIEKRGPKEKHFLQKNGEIVAKVYCDNIHYLKNGKYEEIDNTLIEDDEYYTNSSNSYKVFFNKKSTDDKMMQINAGNHYMDIKLKNKKEFSIKKEKSYNKFNNKIKYNNILENIDIEYKVLPTKIKEAIIIKDRKSVPKKLEFIVNTDLTLIVNLDKSISAVRDGKEHFKIDAPYIIDNTGRINKDVYYEIEKDNGGYNLNLILNNEWLNDEKTEYPITIDPTITNYTNDNSVSDTYIYPGDTGINKGGTDILKAGVERVNGQDRINRALLKFDLPTIGTGSQIVGAFLSLIGYTVPEEEHNYENWVTAVHRITSPWTEENANWSNLNDKFDNRVETLFYSRRSVINFVNVITPASMYANITSLVRKWYTDTPNYGVMIKLAKEEYSTSNIPAYFSVENDIENTDLKPLLVIRYRSNNGIESYMEYQTQNFTKGKASVNTYNGNLTTTFEVAKTNGSKSPCKLDLIYNTNNVILNNNYGYGIGYKLNYHQLIEKNMIDNTEYLSYTDGDGTIHYFAKNNEDNIYYDEDGLNLSITKYDSYYILRDKNNNQLKFNIINNIGYLSEILDPVLNKILIIYNSNNLISKIIDANDNEINITYENDKIIISGLTTTILTFSEEQIVSISRTTGITRFTYDSNNLLSRIYDENGKSVEYNYNEQIPYRVSKITEYGITGTQGKSLSYSYGYDSTSITDNKGITNNVVFNSSGNLSSVAILKNKDDLTGAYGKRVEFGQTNVDSNKLINEGIPVAYIKNYINDSSFELGNTIFTPSDNVTIEISSDYTVMGNNSLKITNNLTNKYISKNISIEKGNTYTFSGYLKNNNNIRLSLSYVDSVGNTIEEYSEKIVANNDFDRYSVTIDYPTNAISDLKLKIYLDSIGIAYLDNVQLEKGETPSNYNLLENSDFSDGFNGWSLSARIDQSSSEEELDVNNYFEIVDVAGVKALKIKMQPELSTSILKSLIMSGKAGDMFNISFWYKSDGIDKSDDFTYNNVIVNFDEVSGYGHGAFTSNNFNPNPNEWQYFSYTFVAVDDYTGLTIRFMQLLNANNVYITNINLIKDIREGHYRYDEKGNVTDYTGVDGGTNIFEYNQNNELIKLTNPKGNNFTIEYDNDFPSRVIKVLSPSGISNEIKYDTNNNPVLSKTRYVGSIEDAVQGVYRIRLKGTDKYLKNNELCLVEDECSHNLWNIEKVDNYYKIQSTIVENKFLTNISGDLVLSDYQGDMSLFELTKNTDGSYYLKCKSSNLYIKNNNDLLDLGELVQDNYNYCFFFERNNDIRFYESNNKYTPNGEKISSTIDSNLNTSLYDVDDLTGLVQKVTNPNGLITTYNYNEKLLPSMIKFGNIIREFKYNDSNLVKQIKNGKKEFNVEYDDFLNVKQIKLGNDICLITNNYDDKNGKILSSIYGNNDVISFGYDEFNRRSRVSKMDNIYYYKYDNNGNLAKIISNDSKKLFVYDISKKLHRYIQDNFKICYSYDKNGNVNKTKYMLDDTEFIINSFYNKEDFINKTNFEENNIDYVYDNIGRITHKIINSDFVTNYKYVFNGNRNTLLPKLINNSGDEYSYKYDKSNNITHIYHNGNLESKYFYDEYNELIEENDYLNRRTIRYKYDNQGNLLSKKVFELETYNLIESYKYEYSDPNWEDKLTKINDEVITYDNVGNPITIGENKQLIWSNGRELSKYISNNTIEYKYNEKGIRIAKKIDNIETKYYLEGNRIVLEKTGNNMIYYICNQIGDLIGFKYNNDTYYYIKNIQDDVIGIIDNNLNVIAKYKYDSWGNIISIEDENGNDISNNNEHIANINPIRYRSYYYDKETNLYYLNQRYYNPEWGRYLNIDVQLNDDVFGCNMYAYCSNNPINRKDEQGAGWLFITVVTVSSALFAATTQIITNATMGNDLFDGVLAATAGGAVAGLLGALGHPYLGAFAGAATTSIINEVESYTDKNNKKKLNKDNIIDSVETIFSDTLIYGTLGSISSKQAGQVVYVNDKWIQPTKVVTVFAGNYAKKLYAQNVLQSMDSYLVSLLEELYDKISERIEQKGMIALFPSLNY